MGVSFGWMVRVTGNPGVWGFDAQPVPLRLATLQFAPLCFQNKVCCLILLVQQTDRPTAEPNPGYVRTPPTIFDCC